MNNRAWQPSIDDLGTPLPQVTFCVVDLETTGSGPEATITEFGAVKVRGGQVIAQFQTLVNPQTHIPALIAVLTGITDEMVAASPTLAQVLPGWLEFSANTVLVAHNASFDIGFLKRSCQQLGYEWPGNQVLDTVALARQVLLRDEVPNCKLATLAAHFGSPTQPNHRALDDAQATVHVLHGLLERIGNLGVSSLDDLLEFTHKVSPQRRAKRVWAKALPDGPGVYFFYCDSSRNSGQPEVLYVGKSVNIRRRVATYFTSSESRRRMEEMIRVSSGVEAIACSTGLEAEIRELRMIAAHQPRYNRRSRRQDKLLWAKLTRERWPRIAIVRKINDDGCLYWGPFTSRQSADTAVLALYEAFPIRQCSQAMGPRASPTGCALADLGRCLAPCQVAGQGRIASHDGADEAGAVEEEYSLVVAALRDALSQDVRPLVGVLGARMRTLASQQRFEEAGQVHQRLVSYLAATLRWHRLAGLARCPRIVAARWSDDGWDINIVRYGKLAGAARAAPGMSPRQVARDAELLAETVPPPPAGLPAGSVEEAERIASWLEQPGVRLMDIDGEWSLPVNIGLTADQLPALTMQVLPATS